LGAGLQVARQQVGAEGVALIAAAANRTNALVPPHTYVPWLVVNGTLVQGSTWELLKAALPAAAR
jgi:hypothetical protein